LCYLVIVQATLLLAASISVVTYVDALLLRFAKRIWSDNPYGALWDVLLPGHGMPLHSRLQRYQQWWLGMDFQEWDIVDVLRGLIELRGYVVVVQHAFTDYLPYWLRKAIILVYFLSWPPLSRPRHRARILAALWCATKLLCACTDLPLPASAPRTLLVLGLLSCIAPKPSDEVHATATHVLKASVVLCFVAGVLVYHLVKFRGLWALKAVLAAVCRCFSPFANAGSSVLVMVGAAEMLAVSAVAQWWQAQRSKLHVKYKYVRRIWRRTGGDVGPFLWQLLHGIESGQANGAASGGKSRGKAGSKRGGKQGAARGGERSSSSSSSSSAARLQDVASLYSSMSRAASTAASYASSSSSNDQEEEEESIADLLTLSPAASLKSTNTKQARSKQSAAKGAPAAVKASKAAKRPSAAANSDHAFSSRAVAIAKATSADTSRGTSSAIGESLSPHVGGSFSPQMSGCIVRAACQRLPCHLIY
jgi:hypothetical protein